MRLIIIIFQLTLASCFSINEDPLSYVDENKNEIPDNVDEYLANLKFYENKEHNDLFIKSLQQIAISNTMILNKYPLDSQTSIKMSYEIIRSYNCNYYLKKTLVKDQKTLGRTVEVDKIFSLIFNNKEKLKHRLKYQSHLHGQTLKSTTTLEQSCSFI